MGVVPVNGLTAAPPSIPIKPSLVAAPSTPCIAGVSNPSRVCATLVANFSCPPWIPSGMASFKPVPTARLVPAMMPFFATSSPTFLAAAAATGLDSFFKRSFSRPVPPATAPIPVPAMMLSQFLPVKLCASNAILETSSLERSGYCLLTSSLTAS